MIGARIRRSFRFTLLPAAVVATAFFAPAARANINLELIPQTSPAYVGDIVEIGLFAFSDGPSPQGMSAMDVILVWDPDALRLLGRVDNGPYAWLFSGFPNDSGLDGLNNTFLDGDALYQALAQLGNPAMAPPTGMLVTTFRFRALDAYAKTLVRIEPARGMFSRTRVFSGTVPGLEVTGTLTPASVVICSLGDIDGDGDRDLDDLSGFIDVLLGIDVRPERLTRADVNCDGDTDGRDIRRMVELFLPP